MQPIITLTTDFGLGSTYVAQMKGVALAINPQLQIVDLTHGIPPQNVGVAAWRLRDVVDCFPDNTIHVVVVDPGVGSDRRILYVRMRQQRFIAPDNGVLSLLAAETPPDRIIAIENDRFWSDDVTPTFHGRDVMVPVAAHLSRGEAADELGSPQTEMTMLTVPTCRVTKHLLEGEVVDVDNFGNLITNIHRDHLASILGGPELIVEFGDQTAEGIASFYSQGVSGKSLALVGSNGYLELAVVNGNAANQLALTTGSPVTIRW